MAVAVVAVVAATALVLVGDAAAVMVAAAAVAVAVAVMHGAGLMMVLGPVVVVFVVPLRSVRAWGLMRPLMLLWLPPSPLRSFRPSPP